jgi:hypothetical protein
MQIHMQIHNPSVYLRANTQPQRVFACKYITPACICVQIQQSSFLYLQWYLYCGNTSANTSTSEGGALPEDGLYLGGQWGLGVEEPVPADGGRPLHAAEAAEAVRPVGATEDKAGVDEPPCQAAAIAKGDAPKGELHPPLRTLGEEEAVGRR